MLPWDTTLTAGYGYRYVDYWHPSPRWPDDDKRVDHEQTFSLELTKRLSASLSLYAAYRYFDNESTLDTLFSYSSTTYSLGLRADF